MCACVYLCLCVCVLPIHAPYQSVYSRVRSAWCAIRLVFRPEGDGGGGAAAGCIDELGKRELHTRGAMPPCVLFWLAVSLSVVAPFGGVI